MITPIKLSFNRPFAGYRIQNRKAATKQNTNLQNISLNYPKNMNFTGYYKTVPSISFEDTLHKNFFQLPKIKLKNGEMYQLMPDENQIQAAKELYKGNSLLYCVATGTGKTAVAHWAMTKNLSENKKSIYTVPVKALANDKYDEFSEIYGKENVGILTGDRKENASAPIVIMTTEIYDKKVESGILNSNNLGTVIFDEAHYIADKERGTAWENSIIQSSKKNIQMLLLSATIGNGEEFSEWIKKLNPKRTVKKIEVSPEERFVPQIYYFYHDEKFRPLIDGKINLNKELTTRQTRGLETLFKTKENLDIDNTPSEQETEDTLDELKKFVKKEGYSPKDISLFDLKRVLKNNYQTLNSDDIEAIANLLLPLQNKVIKTFHNPNYDSNYPELIYHMKKENMLPAIVYRLSKKECEYTSKNIAFSEPPLDLTTDEEKRQIEDTIKQYIKDKKYLGLFFKKEKQKLLNGVGTHHSGKAPEYKALVEELFRKKLLKVVVATSTLGVGIDMPAKSTVVSDMAYSSTNPVTNKLMRVPISVNEFYQMIGRAGRRGQDAVGNVIIYNPRSLSKKEAKKGDKIDEERLVQEYLVSKPNRLTSAYKPSVSALVQYYAENKDEEGLKELIKDSFKVHLFGAPDVEASVLYSDFALVSDRLLRLGFLQRIYGGMSPTPKGKLLALSKSSNPLMLAEMLNDKNLQDVSAEELCQMAGYIAGSEAKQDKSQTSEFSKMLQTRISALENEIEKTDKDVVFEAEKGYNRMKSYFNKKETKLLGTMASAKIDFEGKAFSNDLSGYITYCWAILNQNNPDSVSNFNKILKFSAPTDEEGLKSQYKARVTEGDTYKIIAQTISVLKQISYICDYALENYEDFPNEEHWQTLKEKSEQAINIMNRPPITEFNEAEAEIRKEIIDLPVNTCPICSEPMPNEFKAQRYAQRMLFLSGEEANEYIDKGIKEGLLYPMAKAQDEKSEYVFNSVAKKALETIKDLTLVYPEKDVRAIIEMLSEQYSDELILSRMLAFEELKEIVQTEINNKKLALELSMLIDDAIKKVSGESSEEFKNTKFLNKIRSAFKRYNSDLDVLNKLEKEVQQELPSSKSDLGAFFVRFNKQPVEKIASAFANKKYAEAMNIEPFDSSKASNLDSYIKVCNICKDKYGSFGFSLLTKKIGNFKQKIQNYFDAIESNSKDDSKEKIYAQYIMELKRKTTEMKD